MEKKLKMLGQMEGYEMSYRVYDRQGLAPTINTCGGGNREPKVIRRNVTGCALRKRLDRSHDNYKLEKRKDKLINAITTATKDCMYMAEVNVKTVEDYLYKDFGVFKLSPRECLRLMGLHDNEIDKILSVNSNTQAYKQAGNSIVVSVLVAIFSQLNIAGVKPWNELSEDERYNLITEEGEKYGEIHREE